MLQVRTVVQLKYDGACIIFHHELWRVGGEAPVLRGAVTVYSIHEATKKPSPIPPWLKAKLASFLVA
jgi:acyl-CoA thioesterase FadM